jgi:glycosyltransferase involved in cell wall biosynthesis
MRQLNHRGKTIRQVVARVTSILHHEGVLGLINRLKRLNRRMPDFIFKNKHLDLDDITPQNEALLSDVAVHAHIYYPELSLEIRLYLEHIPVDFHLYITTDSQEKADLIRAELSLLQCVKQLSIHITENKGRDIYPMLVVLGETLSQHELVLHIHTKRSPHEAIVLRDWRRYLFDALLGSPNRVKAIFQAFIADPTLGMLFPIHYHPIRQAIYPPNQHNDAHMMRLILRSGQTKQSFKRINKLFFPSGDMFWFRGKAIQSVVNMGLTDTDFEPECGQTDQTLAHAIERMFPYFAEQNNLTAKSYLARGSSFEACGAHQFSVLRTLLRTATATDSSRIRHILFDHNGGGGTGRYTQTLINTLLKQGHVILRVYVIDNRWFLDWRQPSHTMLFYTPSFDELFDGLALSHSAHLIINSLYGHPNPTLSASRLLGLTQTLNSTLEIKVHDFHAICPSPHLFDFENSYCGVPKDTDKCTVCLPKNNGWYHDWYPEENKPTNIALWRKPFDSLFQAADIVTFFGPSSIDIMKKAFSLKNDVIKIVPHNTDYFLCDTPLDIMGALHIGVLGTLSKNKGSEVVQALSHHIKNQRLPIPITLIGETDAEMPTGVTVHGHYEPNDVPLIAKQYGITVILMPSIVPETFSYTLSEAMTMGLPIVAFDLGAQGNRVRQYPLGRVVPLGASPAVLLTTIQSLLALAQDKQT